MIKRNLISKMKILAVFTLVLLQFSCEARNSACPESDENTKINCLGDISVKDEVMNGVYEYSLYQEIDKKTGDYLIRLKPGPKTQTAGASIERDKAIRTALEFDAAKATDSFLVYSDLVRSTGEDDPRMVQFRLHFDQGQPVGLETYIVARNKDNSAKKPEALKVAWPEKFTEKPKAKPLNTCPENSSYATVDCIGYMETYDAPSETWYNYIVYKQTDKKSGEWEIKIRGNNSVTLTEKDVKRHLEKDPSNPSLYSQRMKPGEDDPRRMEFLIHHQNGSPQKVEIYQIVRDRKGQANKPVSYTFDWPGN